MCGHAAASQAGASSSCIAGPLGGWVAVREPVLHRPAGAAVFPALTCRCVPPLPSCPPAAGPSSTAAWRWPPTGMLKTTASKLQPGWLADADLSGWVVLTSILAAGLSGCMALVGALWLG